MGLTVASDSLFGCGVEARGSYQKGVRCSGAGTGLGDGHREHGHAVLRGMSVRVGDDEGVADGVEGREVPVASASASEFEEIVEPVRSTSATVDCRGIADVPVP